MLEMFARREYEVGQMGGLMSGAKMGFWALSRLPSRSSRGIT